MKASQVWAGQPGFFGAVCAVPLLLASCASPGQQAGSGGTYYFCSARSDVQGPTLVVTEQVFPFDGPISSFPAKAPALEASFAAYAANTWTMTITPICTPQVSETAADTARRAEIGRSQAQGDAIWRVSFWHPA